MARSSWPRPLSRRFLTQKARTEADYARIDPWVQWLIHRRNWRGRLGFWLLPKVLGCRALWEASCAEQGRRAVLSDLSSYFMPFVRSLAARPLNIWIVCRKRIGILHIEPWRQKLSAASSRVRGFIARRFGWFTPPVRWVLGACLLAAHLYMLTHPMSGILAAALAATTIFEVESGASDTLNGGAFDPGQTAGMFTDGAATSANTSAPVFTSASYNFVAGDVNAWVYVPIGTNWIPGWYKIASVAANAATLNGTIGSAVVARAATTITGTSFAEIPSTVTGCATTASPTGATWSIDYSQQAAAQFAYTDLASVGAGLTISSAAFPFAKQQVGNAIVITGGTNFTTGRWVIASVAAGVATLVGPANVTTGVGVSGTGGLGGALASPGQCGASAVTSNRLYLQTATFTVTSATINIAAGCLSFGNGYLSGYSSVRGDLRTPGAAGTRPTMIASGISTFTFITSLTTADVILDGASLTSSRATNTNNVVHYNVHVQNCTNGAFSGGGPAVRCSATGCTTVGLFGPQSYACVAYGNTVTPFAANARFCLSYNNTGASTCGFSTGSGQIMWSNCTAYGNGSAGFYSNGAGVAIVSCVAESNTGYGFQIEGARQLLVSCAAYNNTAGSFLHTSATNPVIVGEITGTATFFTNAAGGDFSLNTTAGGGALARAAGYPGLLPPGLTTGALDIGVAQHANPAIVAGQITGARSIGTY